MNKVLLLLSFILLQFASGAAFGQDNNFIGSWKAKSLNKNAPQIITLGSSNDLLFSMPSKSDSLNFQKIILYDSGKVLIKNFHLDTKNNKFKTAIAYLYPNDRGDKLRAVYQLENSTDSFTIEYAFQMECCSNHNPQHCAATSADLQN